MTETVGKDNKEATTPRVKVTSMFLHFNGRYDGNFVIRVFSKRFMIAKFPNGMLIRVKEVQRRVKTISRHYRVSNVP